MLRTDTVFAARSQTTRPLHANGLMVRDARRCRAPHHEGLRPHPEEARSAVSKDVAPAPNNAPDTPSRSRRAMRPSCERISAQKKQRARGMPGARCTRSLVCSVLVAHECSHHGRTGTPGIPARNGFNGLFRALLGDRAFLSPSSARLLADLTPASRRQDHTTSPSAKSALSSAAPPASTASRPASVTIAIRPSCGTGRRGYRSDLGKARNGFFLRAGLDR